MGKRGPKLGQLFRPEAERFWEKVDKQGPIIVPKLGRCWLWLGHIDKKNGYGKFGRPRADRKRHWKMWNAMRVSCEFSGKPIADDMVPDHLCRNRGCVNPAHAEEVTQLENLRRGTCPAALNARRTHCQRGHKLSGNNLYIWPRSGVRTCLFCKHAREKKCRDRIKRRRK